VLRRLILVLFVVVSASSCSQSPRGPARVELSVEGYRILVDHSQSGRSQSRFVVIRPDGKTRSFGIMNGESKAEILTLPDGRNLFLLANKDYGDHLWEIRGNKFVSHDPCKTSIAWPVPLWCGHDVEQPKSALPGPASEDGSEFDFGDKPIPDTLP
jgi:hypothetical protein